MTIAEKEKILDLVADVIDYTNAINDGGLLSDRDSHRRTCAIETGFELQKMIENLDENILPRPVIRDGNGKLIRDYTPRDFYLKLQEEIFEVMEAQAYLEYESTTTAEEDVAEEISDIIAVCISYMNAHGYDAEKRSEIFRRVNEKNEKRGYFKE